MVAATAFSTIATSVSSAQRGIDPSSALLLNSGTRPSTQSPVPDQESRGDSSRYTTRPRERQERATNVSPPPNSATTRRPSPSPTPVPEPLDQAVRPVDVDGTVAVPVASAPSEVGGRVVEARPDSLVEIGIGSGYVYENSSSAYGFRRYSLGAPAYFIDGKVWLSSEFGVGAATYSTLGATIADGSRDRAATRSEITAGLFFRKLFAEQRGYQIGIDFLDNQLRIPTDSTTRLKLKSSGVRVSFVGDWNHWRLGFSIAPKLGHTETSDAGTKSGASVEAYRVGFEIGRRWRFNDASTMFLQIRHDVEQNSFSGAASAADFSTGNTPDGVGVTAGTTVIQFGFNWGQ